MRRYAKSLNAHIFVEKLGLNPRERQHGVPCPFHPDTAPSMSIDLQKGVFFCHGGCAEPKGGGPVEFLVKWSKYRDGKMITKAEAFRMLRRNVPVPSAQEVAREQLREDLEIFARNIEPVAVFQLRDLTPLIIAPGYEPTVEQWDVLADLYHEQSYWEHVWHAAWGTRDGEIAPALLAIYRSYVKSDEWTEQDAIEYRDHLKRRETWLDSTDYTELKDYAAEQRLLESQRLAQEMETRCRANRSRLREPIPIRTPIPRRTPIH